jgi:alpha-L-fucosidase
MKLSGLFFILTLVISISVYAQHHSPDDYVMPSDSLVQQKLANWQDIKFGLFMHWGTYSQWGIVESWSICPEDEGWTQRRGPYVANYFEYVKTYENLQTTFNPVDFNPEKWAAAAKDAGMKYVVFTTKHHDGFCMFDTKQTNYKITSPKTPFSSNPKSNVTREIFAAFRKDGFMIGAYFSKPDWHCPYYWWPYFPPKDRNVNYDPAKYPERWKQFKDYTYDQIQELMTGYGKMDILWLDGGWVRPQKTIDRSVEWQRGIPYDQDIDMTRIAKMARSYQPGLLVVDRSVGGEFENYTTPEQTIPDKALNHPWESCITMGNSWSYVPNDTYKPTNQLVHMLLKIISRGGNFLLNIGPSPKGDWSDTAYSRLKEIGAWMKVHSEAVYNTKPYAPYGEGNIVYLQSKENKYLYVYVLSDKTDEVQLPANIVIKNIALKKGARVICLDAPKRKIKWSRDNTSTVLQIPADLQTKPAGKYAVAFRMDWPGQQ